MADTVQLARSFNLPVPPDHAFAVVTDAEQIVDAVPGAALTSWDGDSFAATVRLRLGLVPLVGHGTGRLRTRNSGLRHAVVEVARRDGTSIGTVTITVSPDGEHSRVMVLVDVRAPRAAGRIGRSIVVDVGDRMFAQASTALASKLAGEPVPEPAPVPEFAQAPELAPAAAAGAHQPRSLPRAALAVLGEAATVGAGITLAVLRRLQPRR